MALIFLGCDIRSQKSLQRSLRYGRNPLCHRKISIWTYKFTITIAQYNGVQYTFIVLMGFIAKDFPWISMDLFCRGFKKHSVSLNHLSLKKHSTLVSLIELRFYEVIGNVSCIVSDTPKKDEVTFCFADKTICTKHPKSMYDCIFGIYQVFLLLYTRTSWNWKAVKNDWKY